ncbi:MAG: DUF2997 domain-containing protein [Verrucomicrobia bacterium]|nr:DUF2997 domain-containing protein [Verrucomicrobiota bacterium]
MEFHEIDIFIEKNGEVRMEVRGVKGEACLTATKALEDALGGQITAREMTSEASERAEEQSPDRQSQRRA